MLFWGGVTFGIGILLMLIEYFVMKRKAVRVMPSGKKISDGISPTDRKQLVGLFWSTVVMSGIVMFLVWMA